jgi:phosphate transport system substrate-binding protein
VFTLRSHSFSGAFTQRRYLRGAQHTDKEESLSRRPLFAAAFITAALVAGACNTQGSGGGGGSDLAGTINIDGSSTVGPLTEAIAEEFRGTSPDVDVRVGESGTGGGFEKFCNGETDISNASREIKDEEAKVCQDKSITYVGLKVAIDGLSVAVNNANTFANCLTTAELKKIWEPRSTVKSWKDVKAAWPDRPIKLYGPGADSGTFDYFTSEINEEEGASRSDYTQSENDNVLVQGVAGDQYALGYFGYAYLQENSDKIKAVAVDSGEGCVAPTDETIQAGEYTPLSRPLYIYPSKEALARDEVQGFVQYYMDNVAEVLEDVRYIGLPDADLSASRKMLTDALAEVGG